MSNGCVNLALIDQTATRSEALALIDQWTQESDRAESAKRRNPEIIHRFLLGRALVRALIERHTGCDGRACDIVLNDNGKPFVTLPGGQPGPPVSISHSGAMVVAALSEAGAVGVDVEQHRTHRSFDAIAGYAFGPKERVVAGATPDDFYRIWCLREAMSKATGIGLTEAADRVDRVHQFPRHGIQESWVGEERWLLAHLTPHDGYSLAVALKPSGSDDRIEWTESALDLWWP